MFAAIPFFDLPMWRPEIPGIGEVPIDPWATLVCAGFVIGLEVARHRAIKLGMDVRDIVDAAIWTVGSGFVFGHIITVLAYFPERLATDGIWALLKLWEGFSSFGGFLGAVLGSVLFFKVIRKRDYFRYADVITYGFPFAWFFGRLGCGVVHDHVGRQTDFFLGMDFDHGWTPGADPDPWVNGVRHELGLYEAMFMVFVSLSFYALGKKDRVPGFFLGLYAVLYAPVRFFLDFLRNTDLKHQDVRYFGLTPAQYGCIVMALLGLWILRSRDWKDFKPWPMDGRENQGEPKGAP